MIMQDFKDVDTSKKISTVEVIFESFIVIGIIASGIGIYFLMVA